MNYGDDDATLKIVMSGEVVKKRLFFLHFEKLAKIFI